MKNLTGNFELMREMNTKLILRVIRKFSPISRSGIVKKTNLTGATVSRIVSKLLEYGLVQEVGYGESQGGRKPILLELNPHSVLVLGIDIEVDEINGVIIDLNGDVLIKRNIPTLGLVEEEKILGHVMDMINNLLSVDNYREKVIGIGIGMHGLVDYIQGISIYTPAFGWSNVPVAKIINDKFQLPTIVENNVRSLTLAENWFGSAKNIHNFICIKVGSGIGSGIFTNGELYRGVSNSAGEIGHTTVDEDGERCSCGNYGCLESLASIPALIKKAKKIIKQGAKSKINELVGDNPDLITENTIYEAANRGDLIARQLLAETGRYLGISIANTINLLNPEAVILGGKIVNAGDFVLNSLKETVKRRALSYPQKHVSIMHSSLGREGVAIGAAVLVLENIFDFKKVNLENDVLKKGINL